MKKAAIIFVLILVMIIFVFSQTYKGKGRITGLILDETGNPIEGVKVKLFSLRGKSGFEVETDAEGKWIASWLRGGSWNIDFEKAGYLRKSISIHVVEYGKKPPPIEIRLKAIEGFLITDELKAALKEGNGLFAEGKYQEAIAVYNKLIEDFPDAYIINNNIGNAYFQMENYDEAEKYYLKVLEQDPENNDSKLFIGNCCTNRGQDDKALEWYNKIEFEKINDATVLYNIGTKYYNLAKYQEALKYYKRSVEIKNDFLDGIYQLGLVHLSLGNYKDSIAVFTEYKKYDSESDRATQVNSFIEFLKTKIDR
jgi:tetratricopeptide (TPR) repeat protein